MGSPRDRLPDVRGRSPHRGAIDQESPLERSALKFAARCHARQRRRTDGAPFIEHPLEVAALLRGAGCSDVLVAAGLLHDVLADTRASPSELAARFGADVACLVRTVTEDASVRSYRQRKRVLREQVRHAGGDAALLFAADRISKVRELAEELRRDRVTFGATPRPPRARRHAVPLRVEHYVASLRMLQDVAGTHPLVIRLADEVDRCLR
jgi:(p)ppGpp synthase/HD superfamily hydrolase